MAKILLFLMLTLSIVISNGWPSRPMIARNHGNRRLPSILRAIAHYANPFAWTGTPNWPRRRTNRKSANTHYLWVIEIDDSNHWWFTVYEKGSQIPGPDKKAIMKLF